MTRDTLLVTKIFMGRVDAKPGEAGYAGEIPRQERFTPCWWSSSPRENLPRFPSFDPADDGGFLFTLTGDIVGGGLLFRPVLRVYALDRKRVNKTASGLVVVGSVFKAKKGR